MHLRSNGLLQMCIPDVFPRRLIPCSPARRAVRRFGIGIIALSSSLNEIVLQRMGQIVRVTTTEYLEESCTRSTLLPEVEPVG